MSGETLTVLGVETSCDETAAAVVRLTSGRAEVLSSVVLSQDEHAVFGGVVPEIAARAHVEAIDRVAAAALAEAGVSVSALDGVASTAGPGLIGGVMVGLSFGKAVALAADKPFVAVNHLEGHAVSARLDADVPYPFLLLLVSGGHCQLLVVEGVGAVTRLGSTLDDAAGEAFDKTAKALGLGYPGGPALERLAMSGDASRVTLPTMLAGRGGFDFSFSGLKTAAARLAEGATDEQARADLAAAVQAAIARQLAERSARAMDHYARLAACGDLALRQAQDEVEGNVGNSPHPEPVEGRGRPLRFVVAGGVAANGEVRRALKAEANRRGFSFHAPALKYCTDNAAMIALAGAERLALGMTDGLDAPARPRWPLDQEAAEARPLMATGRKGAKA